MAHPVAEDEAGLLEADAEHVMIRSKSRCFAPLVAVSASASVAALMFLLGAGSKTVVASPIDTQDKSLFGTSYAASMSCYSFTGVACSLTNCDVGLGASCQHRECVCEAGCAGPDGKCHNGQSNTLVATDFKLKNVKWPKYAMYFQGVSAFGQMKTTNAYSILNMGKDYFQLYTLPGPHGNSTRFILGSTAYPDHVARIGLTTGTAIKTHALYSTSLTKGKGLETLSVSVCYNRPKHAIMIGNNAGSYWAYIHTGTWLVYGSHSQKCSVGDGGLWKPEPSFTSQQIAMLPDCGC